MNLDQWSNLTELSRIHHTVHYKEHKLRDSHLNHVQRIERKKLEKRG